MMPIFMDSSNKSICYIICEQYIIYEQVEWMELWGSGFRTIQPIWKEALWIPASGMEARLGRVDMQYHIVTRRHPTTTLP